MIKFTYTRPDKVQYSLDEDVALAESHPCIIWGSAFYTLAENAVLRDGVWQRGVGVRDSFLVNGLLYLEHALASPDFVHDPDFSKPWARVQEISLRRLVLLPPDTENTRWIVSPTTHIYELRTGCYGT